MTFFNEKKKIIIHDSSVVVPLSPITDEESPCGSYEDLEEEVKCLKKLLMDKDEDVVQIQNNLEFQESEVDQCQQ